MIFTSVQKLRERADVTCTQTTLTRRVSLSFTTILKWSTRDQQQHAPRFFFMVHRLFASCQAPRRLILASSPDSESTWSTGSRSRAPTAAPRGVHSPPPTSTYPRSTGSRLRAPTAAPRDARPTPPPSMCLRPTDSRPRAPTAATRGVRPLPHTCTCPCPTGSRSRAAPSTPRAVRSSPLPYKGILDATGDLTVPGAPTRLNIQAPRRHPHQSLQTEAPSPPPYHASCGSPLAAGRDRRGRRNAQI